MKMVRFQILLSLGDTIAGTACSKGDLSKFLPTGNNTMNLGANGKKSL